MGITDEVAKIIKSFKPIEIKTEIKNPSIAPVVNYKSPTNNVYNFQTLELNNVQLNSMANKITNNVIEGIKTQVVGKVASSSKLQNELSKLKEDQLVGYLKTTVIGTATVSQVQPELLESGTTFFPQLEELFKAGFKAGANGKTPNNITITINADKTLTIEYDET